MQLTGWLVGQKVGRKVRPLTVLGVSFLTSGVSTFWSGLLVCTTLYNLASFPISWAQSSIPYLLPREDVWTRLVLFLWSPGNKNKECSQVCETGRSDIFQITSRFSLFYDEWSWSLWWKYSENISNLRVNSLNSQQISRRNSLDIWNPNYYLPRSGILDT